MWWKHHTSRTLRPTAALLKTKREYCRCTSVKKCWVVSAQYYAIAGVVTVNTSLLTLCGKNLFVNVENLFYVFCYVIHNEHNIYIYIYMYNYMCINTYNCTYNREGATWFLPFHLVANDVGRWCK